MAKCRKRRFPDKVSALLDMQRIQDKKSHSRSKEPIRVYPCGRCGGWHMTHMERMEANEKG